ncbi:MAG: hypothetical protein ACP5ER_02240, partial [Candidatus Bathyarchaeales archaeon]
PADFIRYVAKNRKVPVDTIKVPQRLLMTYQRSTYEYAKKLIDGRSVDWWDGCRPGNRITFEKA